MLETIETACRKCVSRAEPRGSGQARRPVLASWRAVELQFDDGGDLVRSFPFEGNRCLEFIDGDWESLFSRHQACAGVAARYQRDHEFAVLGPIEDVQVQARTASRQPLLCAAAPVEFFERTGRHGHP